MAAALRALWACTAILLCCGGAAAQVPVWAARLPYFTEERNASFAHNRDVVRYANIINSTAELALYGDSMTSLLLYHADKAAVWDEFFGFARTRWQAERLGVGGSTVEELAWRLMKGLEKFDNDPLVTVLWIGINNADAADAAAKLDALLAWMQGAMPRTRLLVLAPTPQAVFPGRSAALLAAYRPVLRARGVELSLCGQNINPANAAAYNDGLHLSAAAYRVVFSCLKPRLAQLRAQQLAKRVAG